MKVALCYPEINSRLDLSPAFQRFAHSYREFPAGHDHVMVIERAEYPWPLLGTTRALELLYDQIYMNLYHGCGRDIGAHQHAAHSLPKEVEFAVFCSSQVHFHRAGWLQAILEARGKLGPGLYGAMGSFENRPHVRTCFFGVDLEIFREYPHVINSREKSLEFESGPQNFSLWVDAQGASVRVVYWEGAYKLEDCRKPANIFRNGDQSNCLTWDRHTEIYANADAELKAGLERSANGLA